MQVKLLKSDATTKHDNVDGSLKLLDFSCRGVVRRVQPKYWQIEYCGKSK